MDRGRIVLHTYRDGLAATAGHDLTIEIGRWSGELTLNEDLSPVGERLGPGATALLQSTMGNLPELLVGIFAPSAGLTTVVQSAHGIKPYTGFFGALRVRDAVDVDVDVDLSQPDGATGAQSA